MSTEEDSDLSLWLAWKRVNEVVRGRILADLIRQGPLTEPEFTVLAYLNDSGGVIRQNALAKAAGWDRTRLSHLLNRMEERGYLARTRIANGVEVRLLDAGRGEFDGLHAPMVEAVRVHFTNRLSSEQREAVQSLTETLAMQGGAPGDRCTDAHP